jgi:hypothetical protein
MGRAGFAFNGGVGGDLPQGDRLNISRAVKAPHIVMAVLVAAIHAVPEHGRINTWHR